MESCFLLAACLGMLAVLVISFVLRNEKTSRLLCNIIWGFSSAFVLTCTAILLINLLSLNFHYIYVYNHTDASLPAIYRISALWAGQEGSLLTWLFILCATGFFVINSKYAGRSKGLFAAVSLMVGLMCYFSGPFTMFPQAPAEGLGLSAALQDPWMAVHPPLVFISYSLLAALFSFIAIPEKSYTPELRTKVYRWMRGGFVFLSMGIFTGCIWAYRALGWGGYWSWDPVENMAFVPWLILLAFLHDKQKISRFRFILPFLLAAAGTFLVRSGILRDTSTHAYTEGNFSVTVLLLGVIIALLLLCFMLPFKKSARPLKERIALSARDPQKLFKWATAGTAVIILAATLSPLFTGGPVPGLFYDIVLAIYALISAALYIIREKKRFSEKVLITFPAATVLCALFIIFSHTNQYLWLVLLFCLLLPFAFCIAHIFDKRLRGYSLTHIGVLLLMLGVLLSSAFQTESFAAADAGGAAVNVAGFRIPFETLMEDQTLTLSALPYDVILDTTKIAFNGNSMVIPYTLKPAMLLFWVGGGLTCIPVWQIVQWLISHFKSKRKPGVAAPIEKSN